MCNKKVQTLHVSEVETGWLNKANSYFFNIFFYVFETKYFTKYIPEIL